MIKENGNATTFLRYALFFLSMSFSLFLLLQVGGEALKPYRVESGALKINDHAYYAVVLKEYWLNESLPYSRETQQSAVENLSGLKNLTGLGPIAVLPSAIILFLPSSMLVESLPQLGTALFGSLFLSILFFNKRLLKNNVPLFALLCTFSFWNNIVIGQTGLLSLVTMLVLGLRIAEGNLTRLQFFGLILLSSIKLQYLVLMALFLFCKREWKRLLELILVAFVMLLASVVFLGIEWVKEYLVMLEIYSKFEKSPEILSSFGNFYSMLTFSSLVRDSLGEFGYQLNYLFGFGFALLLSLGTFVKKRFRDEIFILLLGVYCLFSPHFAYYEEQLILFPLILHFDTLRVRLIPLVLAWLVLNYFPLQSEDLQTFFIGLKSIYFLVLAFLLYLSKNEV